MAELVIVCRVIPAEASKVVACLENRCLHPVVLDDAEKMSAYRSQVQEIRIAVPETERDMAVRILEQRQRQDELRLFPVIRKANAVVFFLIATLGIVAIVGFLDAQGYWFVGFWVLLTVIAAFALFRWAWTAQRDHHGPGGK